MHRHILGVVAATLVAPYLILLPTLSMSTWSGDFASLLFGIQVAIGLLMFFGIPTLILAGICAAILYRLKLQTRVWCMVGGAGVGLVFLGIMGSLPGTNWDTSFWPLLGLILHFLLSGAACGWIYWRIALKNPCRKVLFEEALSEGNPPRRHKPLALRKVRSALFFNRRTPSWPRCGRPNR